MKIDALMINSGPTIYYDTSFRHVLEDHLSFLLHANTTRVIAVDIGKAYKYEYDLFGYLSELGIEASLHWLIMRMNNMVSPMDFTQAVTSLYIPDQTTVEQIRQSHMTARKVT